jgi:hypothetical protein
MAAANLVNICVLLGLNSRFAEGLPALRSLRREGAAPALRQLAGKPWMQGRWAATLLVVQAGASLLVERRFTAPPLLAAAAPACRRSMEDMQEAVLFAEGVLQNLDGVAAGQRPPPPRSIAAAYGPVPAVPDFPRMLTVESVRTHLAGLSVRQLRRVLQLLGVDSSGCLEKEELVEKVMQTAATDGPAAAAFALSQTSLHGGQEPEASNSQAPGSLTQQPSAGGSRLHIAAAGGQQDAAAGATRAAAAAAPQAAGGGGDSSSRPPERRCARCGASPSEVIKLRRCACGLVRYCGERCQGEDWVGHKAACKEARQRQQ